MTFQELGLTEPVLQAIEELGFASPMPIQEAVIPRLLNSTGDLVGLAQTGTGKTAAYGIPLVQHIDTSVNATQALVVCPTRELCLQIAGDLTDFSKYIPNLHVLPVYGGTSIERQIRALKRGVHIIIATPGRLIDLYERKAARLEQVTRIVLDEADEMLNMGFSEDISRIFEALPEEHTTLLFSATMSKEIERIARKYLHNAEEVVIGSRNEGAELVNHEYYMVRANDKYAALKRVVDYYPKIFAIIFCRTKVETQEVADNLIADGYDAEPLHGDLSQAQRDITMNKFRHHNTQLLVATDVAARGLDVDDLTHVINYGLPDDIEQYTHRSGRTGRAGKKGTSICIVHMREQGKIRSIEKTIGKKFVHMSLPNPHDICAKQLFNAIDHLERTDVDEAAIEPFMPEVFHKLDWLDKEEIIKRFVTIEFGRFLEYYANAPEIEEPQPGREKKEKHEKTRRGERSNRPRGEAEEGYVRFFLALGKRDGLYPRELLGLLNRCSRKTIQVGRIDLMNNFSFFEVPEHQAAMLENAMRNIVINGRPVNLERAEQNEHAGKPRKKKQRDRDRESRAAQVPFWENRRHRPYHKNKKS
ncbi:MAG: DEAD/DEAH box helicase [Bacteroidaceae bacterium]|nr:DEAD/DEAH box helicase [Bacteroidaceae bacterium]